MLSGVADYQPLQCTPYGDTASAPRAASMFTYNELFLMRPKYLGLIFA